MDPPAPRASFAPGTSSLAPSTSPSTSRSKSRTRTAAPSSTYSTSATATRTAQAPAAPPTPAGPSSSSAAALLAASPHYTTSLRSRHSLYGTEDRVVLDLGSSVWKVGFSGEPQPRACASVVSEIAHERARGPAAAAAAAAGSTGSGARTGAAGEEPGAALWGLEKGEPSEVEWMVREERVKRLLRRLWFE